MIDELRDEPEAMREIHEIRLQMYEEKKGMTPSERAQHTDAAARRMAEKYGLTLVDSLPSLQSISLNRGQASFRSTFSGMSR
jgi:predicted RecB family endonuclease